MSHAGHTQGHDMEGQEERGPTGSFPENTLLNTLPKTEQNQLLEMLHVPLLHGGVREVLLLEPFTTSSPASFALACFILAIITGLLEQLRLLLWWVEGRYTVVGERSSPRLTCDCKHCTSLVVNSNERRGYDSIHHHQSESLPSANSTTSLTVPTHTISTAIRRACLACAGMLHLLVYLISTLLMLVAMTMNVYLIVSMGVGAALGKLLSLSLKRRHLKADCN